MSNVKNAEAGIQNEVIHGLADGMIIVAKHTEIVVFYAVTATILSGIPR